ncbi:hypothetical protein [Hufsiella ginkgonis]|uniref:Uncharacterized protein n=1 Tax=Hufsiella ginkgonis TaxID=2695274 RepID=A0A7K1XXM6_9SPHI|nr:hypothetical protein [Hufsiella ginkgonis]MXV15765.1 hypothetical protein [Hufsiella ginkgonis]
MLPDILTASTATILRDPGNYNRLFDQLHELHQFYASLSGISAGEPSGEDIDLPWGKAIGPAGAAQCLLELARTTKFVRGVHQAILQQQARYPGKKIGIFYAGCGPYAALLTPMTTVFSAGELSFTLMDINAASLAAVQKLYGQLALEAYVKEYILDDAVTYRLRDPDAIHLVISETMNQALTKEPQVQIMQNLVPQLDSNTVFIPQAISITAKLTSSEAEYAAAQTGSMAERIGLGTVYAISRQTPFPHTEQTIRVPDTVGDFTMLSLFTDILVFGNEMISTNESNLTVPMRICDTEGLEGREIRFNYVTGTDPHFESFLK